MPSTPCPRPAARRHLLALTFGLGVLGAWTVGLLVALHTAGTRADRSGPLLAVFLDRPGETAVLARVARAGGSLLGASWFPGVWHVHGDRPSFAAALLAEGADLALPPLPLPVLGAAGCFGMPLAAPE